MTSVIAAFKELWIDAKITFRVVWVYIIKTQRRYIALLMFIFTLFILQWLFNIDQLVEIVFGDNPLSVTDRLDFLFDGFINIFRFANDIVPISMILIAVFQSLSFTLLLAYRSGKNQRSKQMLPLGLSILGVGCVACGGSILTPILGLVATNVSVAFAESISQLLLISALVISYFALSRIAFLVANNDAKRRTGGQKR